MNGIQFPGAGTPESGPSCAGPFSGVQIEYPVSFDLRLIYAIAEAQDLETALAAALARISVPCSLIQGVAKPGGKYGRMGARVTVDSKATMDKLYAEAAKLPGVKAVI
jgi:putative lipoic acid-binding regulatory protein